MRLAFVAGTTKGDLPSSYWFDLLYGTVVLLLCMFVCLVGAGIYAKATFLIFLIVMVVLGTVYLSFFIVGPKTIRLPGSRSVNHTDPTIVNASFTGFRLHTLLANLPCELPTSSVCIVLDQGHPNV